MKILHIPCAVKNSLKISHRSLQLLGKYYRIGLVSTTQYLNRLPEVEKIFKSEDKTVFVAGAILGCSQDNALMAEKKVDCFLYVGSGRFHPLGLALKTDKPVFILNPESGVLDEISPEEKAKWRKRQRGRISMAYSALVYGVLVSTKTGQFNLKQALEIKKKLEKKNRKAFLFAGDQITPDNVLPFKVDAWINTACPRLADDYFEKPVLNPDETETLLQLL